MKVGLITAQGCEESEVLTIADILRRAEFTCDLVGVDSDEITGTHHVTMKTDTILNEDFDYDMIVLPGGYGGRDAMLESETLLKVLKDMDDKGRYIAAICAAPEVLDKAGLLEGRKLTCYPGVKERIHHGINTQEAIVVDGHMITGKGPAFAYQFAYKLVDILGGDSLTVKKRMSYFEAFKEE
ncbi:MAG: DJ-1/PfpI family protein [Erysipelotrichaceae bacterium]|nr:DJ-1/PfpI family protein [Erysipelotrichaceae bacterium]